MAVRQRSGKRRCLRWRLLAGGALSDVLSACPDEPSPPPAPALAAVGTSRVSTTASWGGVGRCGGVVSFESIVFRVRGCGDVAGLRAGFRSCRVFLDDTMTKNCNNWAPSVHECELAQRPWLAWPPRMSPVPAPAAERTPASHPGSQRARSTWICATERATAAMLCKP